MIAHQVGLLPGSLVWMMVCGIKANRFPDKKIYAPSKENAFSFPPKLACLSIKKETDQFRSFAVDVLNSLNFSITRKPQRVIKDKISI